MENVGRIGLESLRTAQDEFGFAVVGGAEIGLSEVVKNFKRVGLERVGFFEFELGRAELLFGGEEDAESEMKLNIFGILRGEVGGDFQSRCGAASAKIGAQQIEARFGGGRDDALEVGNGFGGKVFS